MQRKKGYKHNISTQLNKILQQTTKITTGTCIRLNVR